MSRPHRGDPAPRTLGHDGLRPVLLVFIRGIAEWVERRGGVETPRHIDIERAIELLRDAALAPNTRTAYAGALRRFHDWLDGRPPTDGWLATYIAQMKWRRLAYASPALVVAAVRRAVRDLERACDRCDDHPVGRATLEELECYRRKPGGPGRGQAAALRWKQADGMSETAEAGGDVRGVRDAAIIGVASHALLRVSEVSGLDAEDVSLQRDGSALVTIRWSKTDQYGEGAVLHVCPDAARRVVRWMDLAGIKAGPLFRPVRGGAVGYPRLGPGGVRAVIKRRAAEAGIARRVSGHSLRVGAALSLAERGVSIAELQAAGRWTSPAMPGRYVRGQEASRGAVARLRGRENEVAESPCNPPNDGARLC